MGLDMYLETEVSLFELRTGDPHLLRIRDVIKREFDGLFEPDNDFIGATVTIPLAYWRKANAIHRWFVENVQDDKDDCQRSHVSLEQLKTLRTTCAAVLTDRDTAAVRLPTQKGFYFGDTDYNDYYFSHLEYTVKALDRVIDGIWPSMEIYYHASW